MKKFSNITNQKVGQEPKKETKIDEAQVIRYKMLDLMDRFLKIECYGSVDNRFLSGSVKIEGKEMLAEALFDLLSDKNTKEQTRILEGLKTKINNWEVIDEEIDNINKYKPSLESRSKVKSLLEKYDDDSLLMFIESNVDKLTDVRTIEDYKILINESELESSIKSNIIEIYQNRIKQIENV